MPRTCSWAFHRALSHKQRFHIQRTLVTIHISVNITNSPSSHLFALTMQQEIIEDKLSTSHLEIGSSTYNDWSWYTTLTSLVITAARKCPPTSDHPSSHVIHSYQKPLSFPIFLIGLSCLKLLFVNVTLAVVDLSSSPYPLAPTPLPDLFPPHSFDFLISPHSAPPAIERTMC